MFEAAEMLTAGGGQGGGTPQGASGPLNRLQKGDEDTASPTRLP